MLEGEFPEGTYARYLDKEAAAEIRALKSHIDQLQILRNIENENSKILTDAFNKLFEENIKLREALNQIAQWNDGEIGGHMDEPYSAETARITLGKTKNERNN